MPRSIIIAVDGYSSCGKSTLAKELAIRLNYRYIDTGAMYRAVTFFFLENHIDLSSEAEIKNGLNQIHIEFVYMPSTQTSDLFLNGVNHETDIRTQRVAEKVSPVAALSLVRRFLVAQQKQMGIGKEIVMDGRDIGTVVFPNAELKIFMTADEDIRAQRRWEELKAKGINVSLDEIKANLRERDYIDTHREDSPLRKADDAFVLDNTKLNRAEQLHLVLEKAQQLIFGNEKSN